MPSPKNRGWVWYFLVLAVLTAVATTILVVYNLNQQLQAETVERAQQLWNAHGPADYVLTTTVKTHSRSDGDKEASIVTTVKSGKAIETLINGAPETPPAPDRTMTGLLESIHAAVLKDREPGQPRAFVRGEFSARNGALARYIHSVMSTRERIEIVVESLEPSKSP